MDMGRKSSCRATDKGTAVFSLLIPLLAFPLRVNFALAEVSFPLHPRGTRHRIAPTVSLIADRRKSFMHMHSLNWLAILAAAISTMIVGFLWYSPLLFAKAWMREMGYDPNDKARMEALSLPACFPPSPWL
jgi:hypothetical protein